jgi:hypothetical protein
MIDIRPVLQSIMVSNAALAALVGTRVYPVLMPQGMRMPSVVYGLIVRSPDYLLVGSGDLIQDTFQIDSIATNPDSAADVSLAVHACLSGLSGSFSGSAVRGIFRVNGRDLFDQETQLHRASSDYTVWYKET